MRRGRWMYSGLCACILATLAARNPPAPQRLATPPGEDPAPLPSTSLCGQPAVDQAPLATLAIVVLRGPINSTRMTYEIWNYASDSISAVNIDGFDALGGQGLVFSKVTTAHAADVGSVRVEYPPNGVDGRGPIMLGFTGFEPGQCVAVDSEASTWGDTRFHGCVMDAVGARIQVVFERGQRGNGEMVLCGSNGRFSRGVPCHPGDAVALISGSRTMQVLLSQ
jgi:hypothetical protein